MIVKNVFGLFVAGLRDGKVATTVDGFVINKWQREQHIVMHGWDPVVTDPSATAGDLVDDSGAVSRLAIGVASAIEGSEANSRWYINQLFATCEHNDHAHVATVPAQLSKSVKRAATNLYRTFKTSLLNIRCATWNANAFGLL